MPPASLASTRSTGTRVPANTGRPERMDGSTTIRGAVENGSGTATPGLDRSLEAPREDGNNVNLDTETLTSVDTNLRYQLMLRAYDGKVGLISSVLK